MGKDLYMTIESKTFPEDLSKWQGDDEHPFYLELFGETMPLLDTSYAEVVPAGPVDGAPQAGHPAPIYEYWWTIGHPGSPYHRGGLLDIIRERVNPPEGFWNNLEEPVAARVYVYFPLGGGWRIKELAASVKYLNPVAHQKNFWKKAADDWQVLQPLVNEASSLAALVPGPGTVAAGSVKMLNALTNMKINSVPQSDEFPWSAGKVTFASELGVMQGVVWTLPKSMFTELGGRLTGSLAVSFIPARQQDEKGADSENPVPQPQQILSHAVVYGGENQHRWAPDQRDFVKLWVAPHVT
jgi:hypothetical protein